MEQEEKERKVVVRNTFTGKPAQIGLSLFFGAFAIFMAVAAIISGEPIVWLYELLPLAAFAILFGIDLILNKFSPEYVFTPEYVSIYKKGKEIKRFRWEYVNGITVEKHVLSATYVVYLYYSVTQDGVSDLRGESVSCTETDLRAIQTVLPFRLGNGEFCTSARLEELYKRQKLVEKYERNEFFPLSVRTRAAYLLYALEEQLWRMNLLDEWAEKLKILWRFTSCVGVESRKEEWEQSIAKYREEYEAFPEFSSEQENLITFEKWREQAAFLYEYGGISIEADEAAGCTDEQFLSLILQAFRNVTEHTPERDEYSFSTINCCSTVEEVHRIGDVLKAKEINLPAFEVFDYQGFGMYEQNERSPMFGIGYPFNGRVMYSRFCEAERKESERKRALRQAAGERDESPYIGNITPDNASPEDEEGDIGAGIAPVLDERHAFQPTELRLPKEIKGGLICALFLCVLSWALYVVEAFVHTGGIVFLVLLIGGMANLMTVVCFDCKRSLYEYARYPSRRLDWFLLLALIVINISLGLHATFSLQYLSPFGELLAVVLCLSAGLYAVQWIYLCLLPRPEECASMEEFIYKCVVRRLVESTCGIFPLVLSFVFFGLYYNQTFDAESMAIFCIVCSVLGATLFFRANKIVRSSQNKKVILVYRLLCFVAFVGNAIIAYMQGMRTGEITPVDIVMVVFLFLLAVFYFVVFVRSFIKKEGGKQA